MKKGILHDYKGQEHGQDVWELKPALKRVRNWAVILGAAAAVGASLHDVLEDNDGCENPTHQEAPDNDEK